MKAEELMHNDLALLNGKIVRFNTYCSFVRLEDGAQFPRSIQVQPIPLTPEILEKNGYYKNATPNEYEYNYGVFDIFYNIKHSLVRIELYERNCYEFTINYVHELQRVLRCCGLWDLAKNFKV